MFPKDSEIQAFCRGRDTGPYATDSFVLKPIEAILGPDPQPNMNSVRCDEHRVVQEESMIAKIGNRSRTYD